MKITKYIDPEWCEVPKEEATCIIEYWHENKIHHQPEGTVYLKFTWIYDGTVEYLSFDPRNIMQTVQEYNEIDTCFGKFTLHDEHINMFEFRSGQIKTFVESMTVYMIQTVLQINPCTYQTPIPEWQRGEIEEIKKNFRFFQKYETVTAEEASNRQGGAIEYYSDPCLICKETNWTINIKGDKFQIEFDREEHEFDNLPDAIAKLKEAYKAM